MRLLATRLWPLAVLLALAALVHGRLLENDNVLADHALSRLVHLASGL